MADDRDTEAARCRPAMTDELRARRDLPGEAVAAVFAAVPRHRFEPDLPRELASLHMIIAPARRVTRHPGAST